MEEEVMHCRKMASLCRQRAVFYSDEKWAWLARAKMWENRAAERIEYRNTSTSHSDKNAQDL